MADESERRTWVATVLIVASVIIEAWVFLAIYAVWIRTLDPGVVYGFWFVAGLTGAFTALGGLVLGVVWVDSTPKEASS